MASGKINNMYGLLPGFVVIVLKSKGKKSERIRLKLGDEITISE